MDGEMIMEEFDSLWFFSNIFSSPPPPPTPLLSPTSGVGVGVESPKQIQVQVQVQAMETTETVEMEEIVKTPGSAKKPQKSPKSGSKSRDKVEREYCMEIEFNEFMDQFRELGFSFEDIEFYGELTPMGPRFVYPYFSCKMPPFSDGIAMKEHLKSWACAVASTVR